MLVLGDAHATTRGRREALLAAYRETSASVAIQVGDLEYYNLPTPTWFIAGNNENFDIIDNLRRGDTTHGYSVKHVSLLASTATSIDGLRVGGISGNFAPTQYDKSRHYLEGDRRRHFTHTDVADAAALTDIDVFLVHEAPTGLLSYGYDPGCRHINTLLDSLDPNLCLVGHHHQHTEAEINDVRTVSLAPAWEQYYTLDPTTLELTAYMTPVDADPP